MVWKKDLLHFSWSCCLEKEHLKNSSIQNSLFVIIRMLDYMWLPNRYCKHLGSWKWGVLHYPTPGASFFFFIFWRLHCLIKNWFHRRSQNFKWRQTAQFLQRNDSKICNMLKWSWKIDGIDYSSMNINFFLKMYWI